MLLTWLTQSNLYLTLHLNLPLHLDLALHLHLSWCRLCMHCRRTLLLLNRWSLLPLNLHLLTRWLLALLLLARRLALSLAVGTCGVKDPRPNVGSGSSTDTN